MQNKQWFEMETIRWMQSEENQKGFEQIFSLRKGRGVHEKYFGRPLAHAQHREEQPNDLFGDAFMPDTGAGVDGILGFGWSKTS
jgi:hypothetical protein